MKTAPTIRFDIYMAGDIADAKRACREYCSAVGLCVHLEAVDFIYTGGRETGFKVGLINYPRYPATEESLHKAAQNLAETLRKRLCEDSYSIVGPRETEWFTQRPAYVGEVV